jgi:hypothetical protein
MSALAPSSSLRQPLTKQSDEMSSCSGSAISTHALCLLLSLHELQLLMPVAQVEWLAPLWRRNDLEFSGGAHNPFRGWSYQEWLCGEGIVQNLHTDPIIAGTAQRPLGGWNYKKSLWADGIVQNLFVGMKLSKYH